MKKWISDIFYSFPVQLLALHCRNHLLLLATWIFLTLLLTGTIGQIFGIKYLFLTPEYLGDVNFLSHFILGLAFGGFFMTWNLTTYLLDAHYFPFLASLARPFTKFCLNNIIIPLVFVIIFLTDLIRFQAYQEFWDNGTIFYNCLGFIFGVIILVLLSAVYFYYTNKDILSFLKIRANEPPDLLKTIAPGRRDADINVIKSEKQKWRVDTYLMLSLKPKIVRSVAHYDYKTLEKVFRQNHVNALIVQLFGLIFLIALGYLIDQPFFRIPAGASIFILGSVLVAIAGAITYWFNEWRLTVLVVLLLFINYVTSFENFNHRNKAYGLDYTGQFSDYTYENLDSISTFEKASIDKANTIKILNNWRNKFPVKDSVQPKMAIFCVSGGGLKASVWAMQVMQQSDSLMNGKLFEHTMLLTGASGGMFGAAYLRELLLKKNQGENINLYDKKYIDNISKDLLNSIAFTIASNDLFLPWTKFETGGFTYRKDRGYIFEKQLNENTDYVFAKNIGEYKQPELEAKIPMVFITPSIVNDGRRMIISPHGVSYMTMAPIGIEERNMELDAVDFGRLFADQGAQNLKFTTALRMNATYPYILPNVHMPTNPGIEVMDAGFRDNYGIMSATRFIQVFQDWIKENTSGVVLIQVSGWDKLEEIEASDDEGTLESILNPLGIAGRIMMLQDYEHDNSLGLIYDVLGKDNFDVIRFAYHPAKETEKASMTFHLTQREKKDILNSFYLPKNQESLKQLMEIMGASAQTKFSND
jgi:hypothetical protein